MYRTYNLNTARRGITTQAGTTFLLSTNIKSAQLSSTTDDDFSLDSFVEEIVQSYCTPMTNPQYNIFLSFFYTAGEVINLGNNKILVTAPSSKPVCESEFGAVECSRSVKPVCDDRTVTRRPSGGNVCDDRTVICRPNVKPVCDDRPVECCPNTETECDEVNQCPATVEPELIDCLADENCYGFVSPIVGQESALAIITFLIIALFGWVIFNLWGKSNPNCWILMSVSWWNPSMSTYNLSTQWKKPFSCQSMNYEKTHFSMPHFLLATTRDSIARSSSVERPVSTQRCKTIRKS